KVCRERRALRRSMARVQRATASFSATLTREPSTGLFTAVDKEPDIRSPRVEDSENTNAYVPALRARRTLSRPLGCPPLKSQLPEAEADPSTVVRSGSSGKPEVVG